MLQVFTRKVQDEFIRRARARSDDWGDGVLEHIGELVDYCSLEAVYHMECLTMFFATPATTEGSDEEASGPSFVFKGCIDEIHGPKFD